MSPNGHSVYVSDTSLPDGQTGIAQFDVGPDGIELIYEDAAPPHDPFAGLSPPDERTAVEDRRVGGLGVLLVAAMAEHVRYRRSFRVPADWGNSRHVRRHGCWVAGTVPTPPGGTTVGTGVGKPAAPAGVSAPVAVPVPVRVPDRPSGAWCSAASCVAASRRSTAVIMSCSPMA